MTGHCLHLTPQFGFRHLEASNPRHLHCAEALLEVLREKNEVLRICASDRAVRTSRCVSHDQSESTGGERKGTMHIMPVNLCLGYLCIKMESTLPLKCCIGGAIHFHSESRVNLNTLRKLTVPLVNL